MIRVARTLKSAPEVLKGEIARKERADAARHYSRGTHEFDRFPFRVYRAQEVRDKLIRLFHSKCAYCESEVGARNPVNIEHHRPKLGALNLDGEVSPNHYWWLASDWRNLYPICMYCNRSKRTRFPVAGERAEPGVTGGALDGERPLLLDPCTDDPSAHLVFLDDGSIAPTSKRGELTIDVLALNRDTLIEARRVAQWELQHELEASAAALRSDNWEAIVEVMRRSMAPDRAYTALCRQFTQRWLQARLSGAMWRAVKAAFGEIGADVPLVSERKQDQARARRVERAKLKKAYSVEDNARTHKEAFFAGKKWIEWIKIEDFKAINRLHLTFPPPRSDQEPWLTLLGENGTGKSSVLQAVALALMGEEHAQELGLDASDFVRRDARRRWGRVQVKLATIPEPIEVQFGRGSPRFRYKTANPKVLLLSYGATRLLRPRISPSDWGSTHVRIKNLFDPTAPLSDIESWLLDRKLVDSKRFKAVTEALKDLLMLSREDRFTRNADGIEVILRGECPVSLRQLSDGFQSVVALAADMMKSLLERFPTMQDAEGIVLVDELEAHLHPAWKIQIVERLRRTFPRVAFIVSTHDPLCLKGLQHGEIVVLRRDEEQRIVPIVDVPPVNDLRADQILTSPLFGLPSTRGDDASAAIARYSDLIDDPRRGGREEEELENLRQRLEPTLTTQESLGQREVERKLWKALDETAPDAVDALVAQSPDAVSNKEELELRRQLDDLLGVTR